MSQPTLSVLMPNFNHAKFLPKSLGALLSQSRPADEILVLDDCSTDNSWQVLQAMAVQHPNLRCYRNEKNLGVVANNNRGLTLVKSDYVFLTAADDEVLPGLFEATMRILSAYPQAGLGCSVGTWADGATGKTLRFDAAMTQEPCFLPPERMVAMEQRGELRIAIPTIIFKREVLLRMGDFPTAARWHSDWFAAYVAGFRGGICYVPQALTVFNIHTNSYGMMGRRQKRIQREVIEVIIDRLNEPENADSAQRIFQSGALCLFGKPALLVMLAHPRFWRHLTSVFVRRTLAMLVRAERKKWNRSWAKRCRQPNAPPATQP